MACTLAGNRLVREETVNKGDLSQKMASEVGGSNAEAARYLDAFLSAVEEELKSGREVNITGFGKFKVNERPARQGVNPSTGEKMQIRASKVPAFSAGNALKKSIT